MKKHIHYEHEEFSLITNGQAPGKTGEAKNNVYQFTNSDITHIWILKFNINETAQIRAAITLCEQLE